MIKFKEIVSEVITDKKMRVLKTWCQRMLDNGVAEKEDINTILKYFHTYQSKLDNKDILSYGSGEIFPLARTLRRFAEAKSKKNIKINETDKVFEDDDWIVIYPKTYESFCYYASGSRWCTTMKNYYTLYQKTPGGFYEYVVINKKINELDCNRKFNIGVYGKLDYKIGDIVDACNENILIIIHNTPKDTLEWKKSNPLPDYITTKIEDDSRKRS